MTLQNKIKADIAIATILLFSCIALFIIVYLEIGGDEKIHNIVGLVGGCLFPVILLIDYLNISSLFYFLPLAIALNILLYAYIFTKLFTKKLCTCKRYKPFDLVHIVAYLIPGIILIRVIYMIAISR